MKTILVIEDDICVLEKITKALRRAKYIVITARNGEAGLSLALSFTPSVIIANSRMTGSRVLTILNSMSIPFIFLTGQAEKTAYMEVPETGMLDQIIIPFTDSELIDAVKGRIGEEDMPGECLAHTGEERMHLSEMQELKPLQDLSVEKYAELYKKKELIFSEGRPLKGVYYINKGKVKVYKTTSGKKEYITGICQEGDFIGYLQLLKGDICNDSAMALEDAEIYCIPKNEFFTLMYANKDISHKLIKILAKDVAERENQLLELAYSSIRKRIAATLLMLHEKYDPSISLSRENLSCLVGTATGIGGAHVKRFQGRRADNHLGRKDNYLE